MKAIWKNTVLAESDQTKLVEDHHYFPPDAINSDFFQQSDTHNENASLGRASFFHITVDEQKKEDAAWFYPHPKEAGAEIKNYVAFQNGVEIQK
ncbi:MAG: DUF427 domain-containing protein [Salinimicrobium sp.]